MTHSSPAYIDLHRNEIYYLRADLVLMRAPIRGDVAFAREAVIVGPRERPAAEVEAIASVLMQTLLDDASHPVRCNATAAVGGGQLPRGRLVTVEVDEEIEIRSASL